jgi:hypothetical protein
MKKLLVILMMLFVVTFPIWAQDIPIPGGWSDVMLNFNVWFSSLAGVAILTAFLATFANGLLKVTNKFVKQLVAWLIAIILVVVADLANFGFAAEFPIWKAALYGVAAGFVSNGFFDIPWMKTLLDKIEGWFVKKPV